MSKYVFFLLFCITAYLFENAQGMWVVYLFFLGMSMVCFNSDREEKARIEKENEKTKSLSENLEEADKQDKRKLFLWNCFGWSVLTFLAFFSPENAVLFFLFGAFFFNWGDFLFTPIKNFFCGCEKEKG